MDKATFFEQNDVKDFVGWLVENLPKLTVFLRIKQSRFVPKGVSADITGFDNILSLYTWKSTGMTLGDWAETKARLTVLSNALRAAVNAGNHADTLDACDNILSWGGNRNRGVGAYKFLHSMAQGTLCPYIIDAGKAFSLTTASTAHLSPPVTRMNAMLTKVHALYSADGLPIYDSRVAAAIASLVELWRRATGQSGTLLPHALAFPATMTTRTVFRLFPDAIHLGVMPYGASATPQQWSSAKVRLGWIMEEVLTKNPNLVLPGQAAHLVDRMHAFEASLFMIGYDITCLDCTNYGAISPEYKTKFKLLNTGITKFPDADKSVNTLFQTKEIGKTVDYSGNIDSGFKVNWGTCKFVLEPDFLEELIGNFSGEKEIPLGAKRDGYVPSNSLGQWIEDNGWSSRQFASAIAAILCNEKILAKSQLRNSLDFA